jgi:hypothetical protein
VRQTTRSLVLFPLLSACAAAPLRSSSVGLSLSEARQIVADFEQTLATGEAPEPVREPRSLDDVLEILKRDQLDLFPAGVEFARRQQDLKARALGSQLELAWGEAQLDLAHVFGHLADHQREQVRRLASRATAGALGGDEARSLEALRRELGRNEALSEALPVLAAEHVAAGAAGAREVLAAAPGDYLGYRLLADYQRLRGSWEDFDLTVAQLAALNPQSNGLRFLRALSEIDRFGRAEEGRRLLQEALANDPHFVRAQAALVRLAGSLDERYAALVALEAVNPRHQVVVWAGPRIKASYQALQRARSGREPRAAP